MKDLSGNVMLKKSVNSIVYLLKNYQLGFPKVILIIEKWKSNIWFVFAFFSHDLLKAHTEGSCPLPGPKCVTYDLSCEFKVV